MTSARLTSTTLPMPLRPRPFIRAIGAALAAATMLACESPTAPKTPPSSFASARVMSTEDPPFGATTPPTVRTAPGQIEVVGMIGGGPCDDVSATVQRSAREITLTVTGRTRPGPCIQPLVFFAYRATIDGLPAGEYHLTVRHDQEPGDALDETALSRTVSVP